MSKVKTSARQKSGQLAGLAGLVCNLVLFVVKIIFGVISNSAVVIADGINSLTDTASSMVAILGFRMSSRREDSEHPHGHGRMEYVSGFIISMIIIMTAISFGQFAIGRIMNPEPIEETPILYTVLVGSIVVKIALTLLLHRINKKVGSATLMASIKDNVSDVLSTSITLIALVAAPRTSFPVDGIAALLVTVVVLWSGITSFLDNMSLLVGEKVDRRVPRKIRVIVRAHEAFVKVIEIEMHDYGPESRVAVIMVGLKQGVSHEQLERDLRHTKKELEELLGIDATIYWAPQKG